MGIQKALKLKWVANCGDSGPLSAVICKATAEAPAIGGGSKGLNLVRVPPGQEAINVVRVKGGSLNGYRNRTHRILFKM